MKGLGVDKMEYMGNREYWDNKFSNRSDSLLGPEESLVRNISYLKKGTVLDLACGDGRNTLFLLKKNFKVTSVDFSNKALERLKNFAKLNGYSADTIQIDLSTQNPLRNIGIFDNVIINHYRLGKQQLNHIVEHVADKGILFVCGFGYKHITDSKIREEDLIKPSDFDGIRHLFELVDYIENEDKRGFFVTYIFRRKER